MTNLLAFSLRHLPVSCLLFSSPLALVACVGGQTGSEVDYETDGGANDFGPACEEVGARAVASGESIEGSSLSVDALVAMVEGEHHSEMSWLKQHTWNEVVVMPAAGDSSVTVTVQPLVDSAEWVDMAEVQDKDRGQQEGPTIDIAFEEAQCQDFLRMDAQVTVKTENGALNDSFVTQITTKDGIVAQANIPLELESLMGSFDVDVSALENGESQESIKLNFAFGSMSGEVSGLISSNNGQVAMAGSMQYGVFPKDNPCDHGYLIESGSDFEKSLDSILQSHTAFHFAWQNEEPVEMEVTPQLGALCFQVDAYSTENSISAALNLELTTTDDSLSGQWPLSADVTLDESGRISQVHVFRDGYLGHTFANADFEAQTGITGVNSSAEQLSYSFGYVIDLSDDIPVSGELTVLEMVIPDCAREGYVPEVEEGPDGSMSSPGCAGVDVQEIKMATLKER